MNQSLISSRYAKALMKTGIGSNCLEALKNDMDLLSATISKNPMFKIILNNPVIKPQQKRNVMGILLEKRVHPLTLNFINLIIHNRRERLLADITRNFITSYDKSKGIKQAHVVSAISMDEPAKKQLQHHLNRMFQADVKMTNETNPELIGGFNLRVDDQQYDASMSSALKRMRKTLAV